jgi:lipid-A-disaccharide synthase
MRVEHDIRELAVVGLFNVIRHLPMFRRVFANIVARIRSERPDVVLLVDYPDFNLRLAKECRKLGIPVIYFISPQIWAWRRGRVHQIARTVDEMIVILPFEESFYREHGVRVTYAGHPLVEQLAGIRRSPEPPAAGATIRIALLPGSRRMEVEHLLPPMLDAVAELKKDMPVEAFVLKASTISTSELEALLDGRAMKLQIVSGDARQSLASADIAICSSGTATLESAIVGVPLVVVYKLGRFTYALARRLVHLSHFSLVNIIAGKGVVPELMQHNVNGRDIAAAVRPMLDPAKYAEVRRDLDTVRERLGEPGASERVAARIRSFVQEFGTNRDSDLRTGREQS